MEYILILSFEISGQLSWELGIGYSFCFSAAFSLVKRQCSEACSKDVVSEEEGRKKTQYAVGCLGENVVEFKMVAFAECTGPGASIPEAGDLLHTYLTE